MVKVVSFITPKVGEWIVIKKFEKEVEAILYDPTSTDPEKKNPPSLKIYGWPYSQATPKLKFTEIVNNRATAEEAVIGPGGVDVGQKKYKDIASFSDDADFNIGTREECVRTIKQLEQHPAKVTGRSKEKVGLEMALFITVKVNDPILALRLTNFLLFANNLVVEIFRRWMKLHTIDENLSVNTDPEPDIAKDPHLPDDICKQIDKLNETVLLFNGLEVPHVAVMKVGYAADSRKYLESEQRIGEEKNNLETAKHTKEIELLENEVQGKKNDTKVKLMTEELAVQADYITKTSEAIAKQNKAWGEGGLKTLIMNGSNGANQVQTIQVANADTAA